MDRMDRHSLIAETNEVIRHNPLMMKGIRVREGHVNMTRAAACANQYEVIFAPRAVWRFTVAHELAHSVHIRMSSGREPDHGHQWRGVYADLIDIIYGGDYKQRLLTAFDQANLIVTPANLPISLDGPLIDITALIEASQPSRWL